MVSANLPVPSVCKDGGGGREPWFAMIMFCNRDIFPILFSLFSRVAAEHGRHISDAPMSVGFRPTVETPQFPTPKIRPGAGMPIAARGHGGGDRPQPEQPPPPRRPTHPPPSPLSCSQVAQHSPGFWVRLRASPHPPLRGGGCSPIASWEPVSRPSSLLLPPLTSIQRGSFERGRWGGGEVSQQPFFAANSLSWPPEPGAPPPRGPLNKEPPLRGFPSSYETHATFQNFVSRNPRAL